MTAPAFALTAPSWKADQCPGHSCGRDVVPAGEACWSCVDQGDVPAALNIWDAADVLARYLHSPRIARPVSIEQRPVRLSRFPDCLLCGCDVNACRCDPDEYAGALIAARANDGGRHVG